MWNLIHAKYSLLCKMQKLLSQKYPLLNSKSNLQADFTAWSLYYLAQSGYFYTTFIITPKVKPLVWSEWEKTEVLNTEKLLFKKINKKSVEIPFQSCMHTLMCVCIYYRPICSVWFIFRCGFFFVNGWGNYQRSLKIFKAWSQLTSHPEWPKWSFDEGRSAQ